MFWFFLKKYARKIMKIFACSKVFSDFFLKFANFCKKIFSTMEFFMIEKKKKIYAKYNFFSYANAKKKSKFYYKKLVKLMLKCFHH